MDIAHFLFLTALTLFVAQAAIAEEFRAEPAGELDRLFQNDSGWIGADGSYSMDLGHGRVAWLFSDTFVGSVKDGKRAGAVMINNSVAIQPGIRRRPEFYYQQNDGRPASFITPEDERGYYWLFAGARAGKQAVLFLNQMETTGAGGAFGFRGIGCKLGVVENPDDKPSSWRISQRDIPHQSYEGDVTGHFGAAVLAEGDHLYCYGFRRQGGGRAEAILARVPAASAADFESWRFYSGGKWLRDWKLASGLFTEPASEYSVSWLPGIRKYVCVYMVGIWGKIAIRTAPKPEGPWSAPVEVYSCPEMTWSPSYFCYSAKAHPELAVSDDELIVTYACNSHSFADVISDTRIYWPRFVRVKAIPAVD